MKKEVTEHKLNRELSIIGWVLAVSALAITPVYLKALFRYRSLTEMVDGDDRFSFYHDLSIDLMNVIGEALHFALPICLLGCLAIGIVLIRNARKRELLNNHIKE